MRYDVFMRILIVVFSVLLFLAQTLFAQPLFRITFEQDDVGKFPSGWRARDDEEGLKVYSVQAENQKKFLRADAHGLSVQISYEKKWDMGDYPILRWQWRAVTFPDGSNEQVKKGNDSVLGVYVVLSGLPFVKALKYIWSDTLPVGAAFNSPYSSGAKMIVIRSGRAQVNEWTTEERDVFSDYQHFFGNDKHPNAIGIAILTDADNTKSRAVGDYSEIAILPRGAK